MPEKQKFDFVVDKLTEETTLSVDDKIYRILYDFRAVSVFYRGTGVNPILESIGTDPFRFSMLLYVGLLAHQPDIDPETVKGWFHPRHMLALCKGTWDAFQLQTSDPEEEKKPADPHVA